MERKYDYIAWEEEGLWTAHSPSIPGVYGIGATRSKAAQSLFDGVDDLLDYLTEIGETLPPARRFVQGTLTVDI
jgi:predicted RNase H-like HicB family nuclease